MTGYRIGLLAILLLLIICGCSGANDPSSPRLEGKNDPVADMPSGTQESRQRNHYLWSYHLIYVNPEEINFEIVPIRQTSTHWNVLSWLENGPCTDCLKITGISPSGYGTVLIDIEITHPFDNLNLTGFDVRGIAMFNASHMFPSSGLTFSDRTLGDGAVINIDGYTTLYNPTTVGAGQDGMQGYFKGKWATIPAPNALLNAYKRFVSDDPDNTRNAFYASDAITVTYEILMPDDGFIFGYAVDAFWVKADNLPVTDPMNDFPISANCPEAWNIVVQDIGPGLLPGDGTTKLQIDVYDRQGKDTTHPVLAECPELFDGEVKATFASDGDGYTRYEAEIENVKLATPGDYLCLIRKEAQENDPSGKPWLDLTAFQVFPVEVGWPDGYPIDVTPPWLNFKSNEVVVDGDYGYIARRENGLHIFDISDPANPVLVNMFDTPGSAQTVVLSGGYAYVADGDSGLQIIDISTPESAYIFNSVATPGSAHEIVLAGGYAYVLDEDLQIIDIDPPESAYLVSTVSTPGSADRVEISGGYAYVVDSLDDVLQIIDIDPPESASIVNSIEPYYPSIKGFSVSGDYAYLQSHGKVQDFSCALQIIDIQSPESAYVVNNDVQDGHFLSEITVSGGYAYVGQLLYGLRIIDIDPPEDAYTVGSVLVTTFGISLSGNYAYIAGTSGLEIINIETPDSPYLVKSVDTPGYSSEIMLLEDYAYINNTTGIQIISIEPPESAYFVGSIDNIYVVEQAAVSGGYACIAGSKYFQVIDIDPPESAYVLKTIDTNLGNLNGLEISGDYAYLAASHGLYIIDIEPPVSASIVHMVDTPDTIFGVALSGGFAYIANDDSGLQIIDIDPPLSAHIISSVDTPDSARDVAVSGDYAYILEPVGLDPQLHIIDIAPPESACIVSSVDAYWYSSAVAVSGGYTYVTEGNGLTDGGHLYIFDTCPPESAHIAASVKMPYEGFGFAISEGYAYIASNDYGASDWNSALEIIDIQPPESAHIVCSFDTARSADEVAVSEGYAYVGCSAYGLRIIKLW